MNPILKPCIFSLAIACALGWNVALADAGMVTISSPAEGATVAAGKPVNLEYEAVPGPDGDHLHLNVDGHRVDVIRQLKGTATVDSLPAGKHQICLAVNTRGHVPTGVEKCINVTAR